VSLCHQSGQVHTVPFGQIPSLTNAGRDWATVKFNIHLDRSADIEKTRKTIKKIGLALPEDPEHGPHVIAQPKIQGVADIDDTAVRVRLKFTSKLARGSMLQHECLRRLYRALNAAGASCASSAVARPRSIPAPAPITPLTS
jgi:small-conductance mechanosensitive channel